VTASGGHAIASETRLARFVLNEMDRNWDIVTADRHDRAQGRMLFPADGVPGIKRFFVDALVQFGKRGLACQPAIVGTGIGGSKDTCVRLGKEAACLRLVGSQNPDPAIAALGRR
jgi:tartrate dehydratase alpha subunit/fumarate hydratase class I-like protein